HAGVAADMDLSGRGVKGQFKLADREGARWCVIVGDAEVENQTVVLKDMKTAQQTTLPRGELIAKLLAAADGNPAVMAGGDSQRDAGKTPGWNLQRSRCLSPAAIIGLQ